ncbi:DUF1801 domain-containing protein [Flagellimonas meridianipacifica]|uniref:Uncharacterized protein DUF1801 n=1 Tax=Flagellimonas meridianipacifica TaxID=1080225 RepID=A0A2T0MBP5_9FLAO|nr:DUF1801 domain-containing protein [Allomuricauda pacifica]PRX54923.1 uncharacterized protein DUF1801 [Allomuricauda pacifica]
MSLQRIQVNTNSSVQAVFDNYPETVCDKMDNLRRLIIETANETEEVSMLEETLKWGEPSYLTKTGSTIRIDWKPKSPDQYAMYFQCTSRLVPTFKIVFKNVFRFEGKRAIIFPMKDELPIEELKSCIKTALTYHKVKQFPMLGL